MSRAPSFTISLLHATYRAGRAALAVKRRWLDAAAMPSLVEHIFSLDEDDEISLEATVGHERVVNPATPSVTAVRNWNAAAAHASGGVLMVIADDLVPPAAWDRTLREVIGDLDPGRFAFAVKVGDGAREQDPRPTLLRHPVLSRRFYDRWGLFDPRFRGLLCDDDLSVRAFRSAVVLDGSRLALEHRHPRIEPRPPTESQQRIGTADELRYGVEQFRAKWSVRQRTVAQRFFTPPPGVARPRLRAWIWRVRVLGRSRVAWIGRLARAIGARARRALGRARPTGLRGGSR